MSGLLGYKNKLDRAEQGGVSIHRPLRAVRTRRRFAKVDLKASWFKEKREGEQTRSPGEGGTTGGQVRRLRKQENKNSRSKTESIILFVPITEGDLPIT